MREIQTGLWHWQAPHPEWEPGAEWDQMVSSYGIDDGERLLLFDPLAVPPELEERAGERETAIVLTCPWHERDTRTLVERLGSPVFVPPPDAGSEDVSWLKDKDDVEGHLFSAGERLAVGVQAFAGASSNDLVLWVESRRALVAGDTLIDRGDGLELPVEWLAEGVTREQALEALRPLLELPVKLVLPTHGAPTDRAALERALS